jgi:diguanylate cyclase (GGDEF)-like protein
MSHSPLRARPVPLRILIAVAAAAALVLGFVCADVLWQTRAEMERQIDVTASGIALSLDREVARTFQVLDLSLRGVIDALKMPALGSVPVDIQQAVLFDRSTTADYVGGIFVVDESGNVIRDSRMYQPFPLNLGDRPYFLAHKSDPSPDLRIGLPVKSRSSGIWIIPLSRRISKSDGSFGGIVVGAIDLGYFDRLLAGIRLGSHAAVTIFMNDGTILARHPGKTNEIGFRLPTAELFRHYPAQRSGHFHSKSVDGIFRSYNFSQIGTLPMIVNVGIAQIDVDARWWDRAWRIAALMVLLGILVIVLAAFLVRELHARFAAEKRLLEAALTDPLTGAGNRRAFSRSCAEIWLDPAEAPTCVLMIDVDHFKQFNDTHGHAAGDLALTTVSRTIRDCCRGDDLVSRYGGEEFAVLLNHVNLAGAFEVAERIRVAIREARITAESGATLRVTASIGIAQRSAGESYDETVRRADRALYAAKSNGRDRIECDSVATQPAIRHVA